MPWIPTTHLDCAPVGAPIISGTGRPLLLRVVGLWLDHDPPWVSYIRVDRKLSIGQAQFVDFFPRAF
jgi:hypothetical protein